jgi:hypothetical protein
VILFFEAPEPDNLIHLSQICAVLCLSFVVVVSSAI